MGEAATRRTPSSQGSGPSSLRPAPDTIGSYEVLTLLGRGGMASVYLGRRLGDGREVAVKLLHPHLMGEDDQVPRHFANEARIATRIRHPNVIAVEEVGLSDHGLYIAMEYVRGLSLGALVRHSSARLPQPVVVRLVSDVLAGLHAAHEIADERGQPLALVHRDVSPPNIVIGTDGVAKLGDFGIARSAEQGTATTSGVVKGKVHYMAPEQVLGQLVDRRADVWAVGVIAWELFAGRRLIEGASPMEAMYQLVGLTPPPLVAVRSDVPRPISDVIERALTVDLELRTATALELRERLLEAAERTCGVADLAAVAAIVSEIAAPTLENRARRVASALLERAKTDTAETATLAPPQAPPPARRWWLPIAGLSLGAVAIALALRFSTPPVAAPIVTSAQQEPPPAATSPPPASAATALVIRADAPWSEVRIGSRLVVLPDAHSTATVVLIESERDVPISLEVYGPKGRAKVDLPANVREVDVRLVPEPARTAGPRRTAPPKSSEPKGEIPKLTTPPYGPPK